MITRRKFFAQSLSSLALTLGASRLAKADVGPWIQLPEGSQDVQTGLVWLDYSLLTGSSWSYPQAVAAAAAFDYEGYTDWRLPTLNEMLAAYDHGIDQNCPLENGPGPDGDLWWSSTSKSTRGGQGAYAVDLTNGTSQAVLISSKFRNTVYYSYLLTIFVRQG